MTSLGLLWAVHISDGVLDWPALVAGFVGAVVLLALGAQRISDGEIPRVAVLTAVFYVASLISVRVGPTSVHLLLNGLVGLVLGRRAALAVGVGVFLQALVGHGGFTTLGVNTCIMAVPALLTRPLYRRLRAADAGPRGPERAGFLAVGYMLHPFGLGIAGVLCVIVEWAYVRTREVPAFRDGFLTGAAVVVLTTLLNCAVLLGGGLQDWRAIVVLVLLAHLPIAVVEGVVTGFTVAFLLRVKPEMLGEASPLSPFATGPAPVPLAPGSAGERGEG